MKKSLVTEERLSAQQVNLQQARDWVWQHLDDPQLILDVAAAFGLSNAMLGDIAGWPQQAVDAHVVQAFFWERGIDSASLDWGVANADHVPSTGWVPDAWSKLADRVELNLLSGELANQALREQVLALPNVDLPGYIAAFDPWRYPVSSDGTMDGSVAGFSHLAALPASWLTMEALFYGTFFELMPTAGADAAVLAGASFVKLVGMGEAPSVFDMAQPSFNLI
jgi:hypothetical protein